MRFGQFLSEITKQQTVLVWEGASKEEQVKLALFGVYEDCLGVFGLPTQTKWI